MALLIYHHKIDGQRVLSEGEFGNIKNNPIEQRISFATKENARYIRLIATKTVDNSSIVSYGEIGVITQ